MMFTFGELTAGVGTGRLALEKLGCTPVWSCEMDPSCVKKFKDDGKERKCDGEHTLISDTMSKCQKCGSTKTQYGRITYHANFGEYPTYGNIIEMKNPPYADIIVSGFPCPSFSIAGQRKGFEDTRGEVFFEVARIINEVQPKAFILENVQGLLSHDKGRTFKTIKKTLMKCGYILYNKLLNSTDFWVPQNRERVYFVGFRKDIYAPLFDGAFVYPGGGELDKTLGDLLEDEVDEKYYLSEKMVKCLLKHLERNKEKGNSRGMKILDTDGVSLCPITANYAQNPDDALVSELIEKSKGANRGPQITNGSDIARTFTSGGHNSGVHSNSTIILDAYNDKVRTDGICGTIKSEGNSGKTGHYIVQKNQRGEVVQKEISGTVHEDMRNNQAPKVVERVPLKYLNRNQKNIEGDYSFTIDGANTGGVRIDSRLRKLTPLECFRLQGFPDKFVKKAIEAGISDTQLYRQAGNAFTLTVVEGVAESTVELLRRIS